VGTSMVIGRPDGAIDGVYKLASAGGKARLKISDNVQKTTLPGKKKVLRYLDHDGNFYADCVALVEEEKPDRMIHPFEKEKSLSLKDRQFEEVYFTLMENGKAMEELLSVFELRERVYQRLKRLPLEHQRFDFPHIYKVGITERISELRSQIIQQHQDAL